MGINENYINSNEQILFSGNEENLKYFIERFPLSDINELKLLVADCRGEITRNSKGSFKKLFKIISTSLEKSSG